MKINEVIVEDRRINEDWADWVPGGKTVQKIGSGIKGAMSPVSSFSTGYLQRASDQELDALSKQVMPYLNQQIANLRQQAVPEPQIAQNLENWAENYFQLNSPVNYPTPNISAKSNMQFLKTAWAAKRSPVAITAAPAARKVGSYPPPRTGPRPGVNPSVEVAGETYTYDLNNKKWADSDGLEITREEDIDQLNKAYYDATRGPGPTGPGPTGPGPTGPGPTGPGPTGPGPTGPGPTGPGPTGPGPTGPGPTGPGPTGPGPTGPGPTGPGPTGPGPTGPGPTGPGPTGPGPTGPGPTTSSIFSDPAKFASEFDAYVKSLSGAVPPALVQALKDVWTKAGGRPVP